MLECQPFEIGVFRRRTIDQIVGRQREERAFPNLNNVDLVIVLGLEYTYKLARVNLLFDVRAEFGTRNINDSDDPAALGDLRTRSVFATVGVGLPVAR